MPASSSKTQPLRIPPSAPVRASLPTERIGRLDRLPGDTAPPPMPPAPASARSQAVTAPMPLGRRPVRETRPLRSDLPPGDES